MTDEPISPSPPAANEWPPERIGVLVAGGAIVAGCIGPWAVVNSAFGSIELSGMDADDGKYLIAGGGAILLFAFVSQWVWSIIVGALVTAGGVYEYVNARDALADASNEYATASVGWGIYAIIGGGLGAIVLSALMNQREINAARALPDLSQVHRADP